MSRPERTSSAGAVAADHNIRSQNRFHWELRSFHLNEDSFRARDEAAENQDDRTKRNRRASAIEIFGDYNNNNKSSSSSSSNKADDRPSPLVFTDIPTRTAVVDGKQVCFALRESINQRPTTDRETRMKRSRINLNAQPSHWEVRLRLWTIKFSLIQVTIAYLAVFVTVNVTFAALFYIHPNKCCDDKELTFAQVFDFTVQTSTTIGYGGYVPIGYYANFLVVLLSYVTVLLNTVFAGLLFLKFVTPTAKLVFSDVMVYSNVNGLPCLQVRVGNADGGTTNPLSDVTARLTHVYMIRYSDEHKRAREFGQSKELVLLNAQREHLSDVWTLKHVIDETSPLFGLNFSEYPGNDILQFNVTINAIQEITKAPISATTSFMLQDVLIGHAFEDQITWDADTATLVCDYAKMSETVPSAVWYPEPSRL